MTKNIQRNRFIKALFGNKNETVVYFKIFLEDGHGLNQEEIYKMGADQLEQEKSGRAKPKDSIDGDMPKINIDRFLGEKL